MSTESFLTHLEDDIKLIGQALATGGEIVGPVVSTFNPVLGLMIMSAAGALQAAVIKTEQVATTQPSDTKRQMAASDFDNAFQLAQSIITKVQPGAVLTYDSGLRDKAINSTVQSLNDLNALEGSVKLVPAKSN